MKELELYIHIPFCIKKCNYCDFLSFSADEKSKEAYVDALLREIRESGRFIKLKDNKEIVTTIFIGGGTPSILSADQMKQIMQAVHESFDIDSEAEISIETNPGTLSEDKLNTYLACGVNRLSMGVQSTQDSLLKILGRIHTYEEFMQGYEMARKAGFKNINIDLMSALPGQTLADYENTLEQILTLRPEHISAYSLIIEEGTPFYDNDQILDSLPSEEDERCMYEMTERKFRECGYHRYEISNYSLQGKECRHNLGYWSDVPYLGLGLGASSYYEGARFQNTSDLKEYLEAPDLPFSKREGYQILSVEDHMEEYMFLGLRKMEGVSVESFTRNFKRDIFEVYGEVIRKHMTLNLLEIVDGCLRLTRKGIDVCNRVMSDFLL